MAKADESKFLESLRNHKIPLLTLDQKWHHLFHDQGKTERINDLEHALNELMQRQGALNTELKELKVAKSKVMDNVMMNMEKAKDENPMRGEEARLIDEINAKMEADQDELLDLPVRIKEANEALMLETMKIMYERLHKNAAESLRIKEWITKMRVELKKNIIRKQNMDLKNQEIYNYMHDIYGASVLDLFDVKYEEKLTAVDQAKDTPHADASEDKK